MRDNAKDFQYGVFPLPLPPDGQQRTIFGGWAFVANAKGKNPEEAAKFGIAADVDAYLFRSAAGKTGIQKIDRFNDPLLATV